MNFKLESFSGSSPQEKLWRFGSFYIKHAPHDLFSTWCSTAMAQWGQSLSNTNFNFYTLRFHEKFFNFESKYFSWNRNWVFAMLTCDFRIVMTPLCLVFFIFRTMAWWPNIRLFLAFVLYLCLIFNQIIIMPEPNSSAWKNGHDV